MKSVYYHPQIGNIELSSDYRCKGIKYSVYPHRARISYHPFFADNILPLSKKKVEWFIKNRENFSNSYSCIFLYRKDTEIQMFTFKLKFSQELRLGNTFSAILKNGELVVRYGANVDFKISDRQYAIKNIVKHFLIVEAKRVLPEKLNTLAIKHGFTYHSVKITTAKTRWGSCNYQKRICLSAYMLILSEEMIDFIIIHELCHTIYMNHSKQFYSLLATIYPNYRQLNKLLKAKNIEIMNYI